MTNLIRVSKRKQFVMIEKPTAEDKRLSWAARGILVFLLAKPDDWQVMVENLVNNGDLKRDGIHKRIKELIGYGYIRRRQLRDNKGRIVGNEYIVYERPYTDNPDTDKPSPDKTTLLNNHGTNKPNSYITTTTTHRETRTNSDELLEYSKAISPVDKEQIAKQLYGIPTQDAQMLLDELGERLTLTNIKNPIGYMRALISRYRSGDFQPEAGLKVSKRRSGVDRSHIVREASEKISQQRIDEYQAEMNERKKASTSSLPRSDDVFNSHVNK